MTTLVVRLVRAAVAEHSQSHRDRHSHAVSCAAKWMVRGERMRSWKTQPRVESLLRPPGRAGGWLPGRGGPESKGGEELGGKVPAWVLL